MSRSHLVCAAALVLFVAVGDDAQAGTARIAAGGVYSVPVTSYTARFFETVVRQQYDYSCGSAAVATLLTHHYDLPTSEAEAFAAMFASGDQARIREVGFSLLDIKLYLESRGLAADGFTVPLSTLAEVGVPAITLIETDGYRHFVVVKGLSEDSVLVGDPALGLRTYTIAAFERLRIDSILFLIRSNVDVGQANFNRVDEWRLRRALAPLGVGIERRGFDTLGALARLPAQFGSRY